MTILLSLTVFLNLVAETLPQVSDAIPLLGRQAKIITNLLHFVLYEVFLSLFLPLCFHFVHFGFSILILDLLFYIFINGYSMLMMDIIQSYILSECRVDVALIVNLFVPYFILYFCANNLFKYGTDCFHLKCIGESEFAV